MKKVIFMSAFAAIVCLMTSCSEDESLTTPSLESNSIVFATRGGDMAMTRSGVTATSISKFTVSAVNEDETPYFSGVEFNYNGLTGTFNSQTPYYWPLASTLNFYAISDVGTEFLGEHNRPSYGYTKWGGESDLVAATVLSGEKVIPYPLIFQHILSQVSVSAEAKDKTEHLTYKLMSVEMESVCDGTYSFADATGGFGSWDIDYASNKTYSFEDALPLSFHESGSVNSGSTYWNILPNSEGKIIFTVGYQVFQNGKMIADYTGDRAKYCEVNQPELAMGKRYVYNFELTHGNNAAITFTTTIVDWKTGATVNCEPEDDGVVYLSDSNMNLIAKTRTVNEAIRISDADGRSGNIITLHDNANVEDLNVEEGMSINVFVTPMRSVILNLNSYGLLVNGEPMSGEGIQGNANVTILLNDNGQNPYTNKSKVVGSPIMYQRNFATTARTGKWQALFLPFSATVPTKYDFGVVKTIDVNSETSKITVDYNLDDERQLDANTPYVIRSFDGMVNITNPCGELTPAEDSYEVLQIGETDYTIQGCVNFLECVKAQSMWVLTNGGQFSYASVGTKQRPYHWVIYCPGNNQ